MSLRTTPTRRIDIARYYLSHMDMTQKQVGKKFGVSHYVVASCMQYYMRVINTKPHRVKRHQYEGIPYTRNDLHRFENLIY